MDRKPWYIDVRDGRKHSWRLNRFVTQIFIDSLGESYTTLQAYKLIVWLSLLDTETAGPGLGYNRSRRASDNSTARTERVRCTGRK
jgi:hypothetical protein